MKRVEIKGKKFKIIPEARLVQGEMNEKGIFKDLKVGAKRKYKNLVREAVDYNKTNNWFNMEPSKIYANAYCDKNDEFDERRGIEVCAAKLELKNHRKLAKWFSKAANDLLEASLLAQSFCVRHEEKAQAIEDDLCRTFGRLKV